MATDKDERVESVTFNKDKGYLELERKFPEEKYLWNEDFHPTPFKRRTWGSWTFFAVWFGMAIEVESWALVSLGYSFGLDTFWSLFAVVAGNLIVLIPMIIQSHGGARYGVPETPLTRSRWGIYGNWIPSILRGVIGAGWWGIDTWIIAECVAAMYLIATNQLPFVQAQVASGNATPWTIATVSPTLFWAVFVTTIAVRLAILYKSQPKTGQRVLQVISWTIPFIGFVGFGILFVSMMNLSGWHWTAILSLNTGSSALTGAPFWYALIGLINANVAFWATMAISMPDYTRFSKSQFAQTAGQLPLPILMGGIGGLALVTTGASMVYFGVPVWDPVLLTALVVAYQPLAYLTLFLLLLGVIVVNVYADTIGPAYDFSNIYPKKISWFGGVLIVVAIAAVLQSWSYYVSAQSYVENWLLTYGVILGAVEGIIIFDYGLIRRFKMEIFDLFYSKGRFRYFHGINPAAVIAFAITLFLVFPPGTYLPASWVTGLPVSQLNVPTLSILFPGQDWIFQNSWISAILIAGFLYTLLMVTWIIPKYQPELKGNLVKGYIAPDTAAIFAGTRTAKTSPDAAEASAPPPVQHPGEVEK
jgi:NCS1 family nucleobase:cation symporter-1